MQIHRTYTHSTLAALWSVCLLANTALAENVDPLIKFLPDTPAFAAEVNANFDALKIAVDDNAGDIDQLEIQVSGKQNTVSGNCPPGSSIRDIAANGAVTCETDDDSGGDITGVTVGSGLIGGGTSGNVNIMGDTSVLQLRIGSSCTAGSSIRAIAADGTVTCQTDADSGGDITAVNAGSGLSGGGSEGNVTLSIPIGGVSGSEILNASISDADISPTAAIEISKILGATGVEFTSSLSSALLNSTIESLGNIKLTAPRPGFAVIVHSGVYSIDSDGGDIGIGTTSGAFTQSIRVIGTPTASVVVTPYMLMDVVQIPAAGSVQFFALARNRSITRGGFSIDPSFLAAIFVPNRY